MMQQSNCRCIIIFIMQQPYHHPTIKFMQLSNWRLMVIVLISSSLSLTSHHVCSSPLQQSQHHATIKSMVNATITYLWTKQSSTPTHHHHHHHHHHHPTSSSCNNSSSYRHHDFIPTIKPSSSSSSLYHNNQLVVILSSSLQSWSSSSSSSSSSSWSWCNKLSSYRHCQSPLHRNN